MTKNKYYGDKADNRYFTPSSTTAPSSNHQTPTVPEPDASQTSVIDEAVKSYTKSSHKLVVKRYAVKRG